MLTSKHWRVIAAIAGGGLLLAVLSLVTAGRWLEPFAQRKLKEAVEDRFNGRLKIEKFAISLVPSVHVAADGVVLQERDKPNAPPLLTIRRVSCDTGLIALLTGPRLNSINLEGLQIRISHGDDHDEDDAAGQPGTEHVKSIEVGQIVADDALLQILPKTPGKEPLTFDIHKLKLNRVGRDHPMRYQAELRNAKPPGLIHATGEFGPWQQDHPGQTHLTGQYTFRNADLSVFKGIRGILSSTGSFHGVLDRIEAKGTTETPDFMLTSAGHAVNLTTEYSATIDGTSGDTLLHPVIAHFRNSTVTASGGVTSSPGIHGKTVSLDATVDPGRIEDVLFLGVKSSHPLLSGHMSFQSKIVIPPGDVDVVKKLQLNGAFEIESARFSSDRLERNMASLSKRAQGKPEQAADAQSVASDFRGRFTLHDGAMRLSRFSFQIPGATIRLDGTYDLQSEQMDFEGTAQLAARVSEMTTGVKSLLLKLVDPIFSGKHGGSVIPIQITGTRTDPHFGLRLP